MQLDIFNLYLIIMENQQTVRLIGFKAENSGIIKAVELTPDLLSKQLIVIRGESGNGKSYLIKNMQTAISGAEAIVSKNVLEKGYITEAQLLDGDIKLYAGAKVTEYQKGEKKGEKKFETFLYTKDLNGKHCTPIINGIAATAGKYIEMLTTELTFNMPALFSENQTIHRQLIERLYKNELDEIGAEEVAAKIIELKKHRDTCRMLCQNQGAYMEQFETEGFNEVMLASIRPVDVHKIDEKITQKRIEKDRVENQLDSEYNLEVEKLKSAKEKSLQKIKDEILEIREKIRADDEAKKKKYDTEKLAYDNIRIKKENIDSLKINVTHAISELFAIIEEDGTSCINIINDTCNKKIASIHVVDPILPQPDAALALSLEAKTQEWKVLNAAELTLPKKGEVDTSKIDSEIEVLLASKKSAEEINALYNRFQLWQNWIEAQHKYEQQVDILRAMYSKIDCGVEGMHIVPTETESGRIEVWIKYDGSYDTAFFHNEEKECRFMFEYSSFQRAAIGVMLQAARLDLKPKVLRLAIIDDIAFTAKGLSVLDKMCEDFKVQLITSMTADYDKANIADGEVIIENGEVFFNH